jgi:butyryl-CoA dehydrogenase
MVAKLRPEMDFQLDDIQQQIDQLTRDFAAKEVRPKAVEIDEKKRFPAELVAQMAEMGLMGMMVPEDFGGTGLDTISYAIAIENISWGCASTGVIMSVNNSLYCDPITHYATDAQKAEWLTPWASGQKLGCFGLTEPTSGSDAQNMLTRAEKKEGGGWIVRGQKNFITNGPQADAIVCFATTRPGGGSKSSTAFVIPRSAKGYVLEPNDSKLGIRGSHSCTITFDEVEVADEQMIGEVGQGFKIALGTLDGGRIGIAAQALGIARAAFEAALDWSKERKSFGVPISQHQAVQFKLADMATQIEAARALTWRAAYLKDKGVRHSRESAMAKLYASEVCMKVCTEAVQVFGGYGYCTEYPAERHFRDAKICEIYECTSEIQRIVIATNVLRNGALGALGT